MYNKLQPLLKQFNWIDYRWHYNLLVGLAKLRLGKTLKEACISLLVSLLGLRGLGGSTSRSQILAIITGQGLASASPHEDYWHRRRSMLGDCISLLGNLLCCEEAGICFKL